MLDTLDLIIGDTGMLNELRLLGPPWRRVGVECGVGDCVTLRL